MIVKRKVERVKKRERMKLCSTLIKKMDSCLLRTIVKRAKQIWMTTTVRNMAKKRLTRMSTHKSKLKI